jgi:hypothetical protein
MICGIQVKDRRRPECRGMLMSVGKVLVLVRVGDKVRRFHKRHCEPVCMQAAMNAERAAR